MYKKTINLLNLITNLGGHPYNAKSRFAKYSFVGIFSTFIDYILLLILVEIILLNYMIGVAAAFILSSILAYSLNRKWGFKETKTKKYAGGIQYLIINTLSLIVVLLITIALVEYFTINYFLARIIGGIIGGLQGFILNTKITFKMKVTKD